MAAWQIQGRDAFSATSGTGAFYQAPIEIGQTGGNALTLSTPVMIGFAAVAGLLLVLLLKRGGG